ncbi:MAG: glycine betaine ABC transporter substrate-binding protein, partial [Acidimicrobiales bacterium]|nr:glycine betaine ABC transporter substrate-binding protein [Acidimicrobiales bacterium]
MLKRFIVILAALAMVASACGSDSEDSVSSSGSSATSSSDSSSDSSSSDSAGAADSSDPIKLPIHNWSSQIAGVYAVGTILEATGASVEYISSDSTLVYTAMCEGDMDLVHEVWEGAFGVAFMEQVDKG